MVKKITGALFLVVAFLMLITFVVVATGSAVKTLVVFGLAIGISVPIICGVHLLFS